MKRAARGGPMGPTLATTCRLAPPALPRPCYSTLPLPTHTRTGWYATGRASPPLFTPQGRNFTHWMDASLRGDRPEAASSPSPGQLSRVEGRPNHIFGTTATHM